jgi:molybdate transport system substrate-binding protein
MSVLPLTACGGGGGDHTTITVLAASSLTGTFTELGKEFEDQHPGVTVKFAFDSSATLAQQATQGAPADVLATADTTTMDRATSAQASTPQVFASNEMVLATPKSNPGHVTSFADLDRSSVEFVVCVPTAPCGRIAQALLDQDHVTGKPVSEEVDVKSVLAKLTEGEADAGIVYTSDAVAAGDQVSAIPIPGSRKQLTTYPIVTLSQSEHADLAQAFVDLVTGSTGRRTLRQAGFGRPWGAPGRLS